MHVENSQANKKMRIENNLSNLSPVNQMQISTSKKQKKDQKIKLKNNLLHLTTLKVSIYIYSIFKSCKTNLVVC